MEINTIWDDSRPGRMFLTTDNKFANDKFSAIRKKFKVKFGEEPSVYLRVPGRVNLIGEHVDYCGYSVCPMAIRQEILIAAKVATKVDSPFLHVVNLHSEKYSEYVTYDQNFKIDLMKDGWVAYFLCGVKGVIKKVLGENSKCKIAIPMMVVVGGDIPTGAGLSSSSAMVCASFLVTSFLNEVYLNKTELATMSAESEQYIGTIGGGMDQAIAILATKGCAKLIDFAPVRTKDVLLPEDAVFVIANSLVVKNKAESSDYNTRVVECRLAAQILAKQHFLNWQKIKTLKDLQNCLKTPLDKMIELASTLHPELYTKDEVCKELDVNREQLDKISLTPNTTYLEHFQLRNRALHVFTEALRVEQWCKICWKEEEGDLKKLGSILLQSHKSLSLYYECSHDSLDKLVNICMEAGALGARLTGAGWGGCIVALITKDKVDDFMKKVRQRFYSSEEHIFATEPCQGAEIYLPLPPNQ